ncbi:hypothetical protein Cgig2_010909 [Carnegiea gigantea]|uniref:F-box domain-containing protein n=1 Tax=Carnegiea gigantea TaxID=171969 RepID=A0A9Q1JG43_9CARY|nr:hypothetical protein Cgig2_010909 [Carnegiea gigantea]
MAELMDLPVDSMFDILLRFPAKPLMQFKSVCKLWYQIICSPHFANLHFDKTLTLTLTQMGNANLRFIFSSPYLSCADFDTFGNITELDHPLRKIGQGFVDVVGSCNGLLCLCKCYYDSDLTLYNPTTRTILKSSDEFLNTPFWNEVMVYSLRADSWTRVRDFPHHFSPRCKDGVFCHGNLHWATGDFDGVNLYNSVVSFSLRDNKFNEVQQPHYEGDFVALHVGVLDGCLRLLANDLDEADLWIMKEYGVVGSWTRLFRIRQQHYGLHFQRPIAFSANRQELFLQLTVWRVVSLDLGTMTLKDVRVSDFPRCFDTHVCMENLMMLTDVGSDISGTNHKNGRKRKRRHSRKKKEKHSRFAVRMQLMLIGKLRELSRKERVVDDAEKLSSPLISGYYLQIS